MNTRGFDTLADICQYDDWVRTGLLKNASEGLTGIVQTSLTTGSCADRQDSDGFNALMGASQSGKLDTVCILLENGASVNDATRDGATALHYSAQEGHLDVVEALIEAGADVNARMGNGCTALSGCAYRGHLEIAKELLSSGTVRTLGHSNGVLPFFSACARGHTDIASILLEKDCDFQVDCRRSDGSTPLLEAARGGFVETIKLCLQNGASVSATRKDGQNALTLANAGRHTAAAALLRESLSLGVVRKKPDGDERSIALLNGEEEDDEDEEEPRNAEGSS